MDLLPFDLLNLNNYAKYLSGQYQGKHLFQKRLQAAGLTATMNASKFILKLCLCKFLTSIVFCIRYFNRTHHTVPKVCTPFYRQPIFFFFFSETLPFSSIDWQYCPNKIPGKHKNKLMRESYFFMFCTIATKSIYYYREAVPAHFYRQRSHFDKKIFIPPSLIFQKNSTFLKQGRVNILYVFWRQNNETSTNL